MADERINKHGARDGRSLDHDTLEQIRLRAVARIEAGERIVDVARTLGFDRAVVGRWVAKARKHGVEALHAKPIPGRPPSLDDRQVGLIRDLILSIPASFWGFASELWTRAMVAHVIERVFGVTLSEGAVGQIMRRRMGLTPQRPVRRAFECDPEWGRQWVEEEYPRIRARADKRAATIYFADEAAMSWDYHSGTSWAPEGDTPVIGATGKHMRVNLISAISPGGELRWMEVDGSMTAERFIEFLERLIKGRKKPVYVIVDGHPTHRAKAVKEFVKTNRRRLELYVLPSYSPHLNPARAGVEPLEEPHAGQAQLPPGERASTTGARAHGLAGRVEGVGEGLLRGAVLQVRKPGTTGGVTAPAVIQLKSGLGVP